MTRAPIPRPAAPRRGRLLQLALTLAAGLLLAGCSTPRPAPTLLTLPPAVSGAGSAPAAPVGDGARTLALRRVSLPEYLEARRVRYRADAATLVDWQNTYWAERIEVAVSREFAAALRQALPGWVVCETDCSERSPVLALQVEWIALDYWRPERRVEGRSRWQVSSIASSTALLPRAGGEQGFTEPVSQDSPQAQAHAMTVLLRSLAERVARDVQRAAPAPR